MKTHISRLLVTNLHFPLSITIFYFLLTHFNLPTLSAGSSMQPLLISPFTQNVPVIDGHFSVGEWDDAAFVSATIINDTSGPEIGRVYIKHDLLNLYLLYDNHTATGGNTEDVTGDFWLDLDNNGTNDGGFFTRIMFGTPDTNWDFPGRFAYRDTSSPNNPLSHWIIEYEFPFSGIGIQPGDMIGAHCVLFNFLGTGGEWYNASNLLDLNFSANWADLLLMRGDSLDPLPPESLSAFSDYQTPTSVLLTWDDPTHYQGGDTLTTLAWIEIYNNFNDSLLDSVGAGVESYVHPGLMDGIEYGYYLIATDAVDSSSNRTRSASWHAGGHPFPSPPESLSALSDSSMPSSALLSWKDPSTQVDGTYLDDLVGIRVYHSGPDTLVKTVAAGVESTTISGLPGWTMFSFHVTSYDDEIPVHESVPSDTSTVSIGGIAMEIVYDDSVQSFSFSNGGGPMRYIGVRFSVPPILATPFDIVRVRIWLNSTDSLDEVQVCPSSSSGIPEYLNPYEVEKDVSASSPNTWSVVEFPNFTWIDTYEDLWVLARWEDFVTAPALGVDNSPPVDYRSYTSDGPPSWDLYVGGDMMVRLTLGSFGTVGVEEIELRPTLPLTFYLAQNQPNPFNQHTAISYQIPNSYPASRISPASPSGGNHVSLKIYDITGRLVKVLVDAPQKPGIYQLPISNRQLPSSGIYFYRLTSGEFTDTKKLILLR
jgi:hypothetical protein